MRAYAVTYLGSFVLLYLVISFFAVAGIAETLKYPKTKKLVISLGSLITGFIAIAFTYLYIWPLKLATAVNYSPYLLLNGIFSVDFGFKFCFVLFRTLSFLFNKSDRRIAVIAGLIIAIGFATNILLGIVQGKNELKVKKIVLQFGDLPEEFDGYSLLQFSDVHLGSFFGSKKMMKRVAQKVNDIKPSAVFFTGDLFNNYADEFNGWEDIFENISAKGRAFAILGNHDYGNYSDWPSKEKKEENFSAIVNSFEIAGFKLLRNENISLKSGTDSVFIAGVENWGHPPFPQYADLGKAMRNIPDSSFVILLTHDPSHWREVVKFNRKIQLSLSGHTHGIQWGIKLAGITFSPAWFVRKNWSGLYEEGNSRLYVNPGTGLIGVPWRIDMPAELTLIILKRVEID